MADKFLEIVSELNSDLYDAHGEVELSFWYRSNGFVDQIGFDDKVLWCSEAHGTQYIEDTDEEMPMRHVIRKAFNEYADKLRELKCNAKGE